MSFYYIKKIKFCKNENKISADLGHSSYKPIDWFHVDDVSKDKETYEEKYAKFIYNLVSGNIHPYESNKLFKLVCNPYLHNYYDDAHDIGELKTYYKYQDVVDGILSNIPEKCIKLKSERELNPNKYYVLHKVEIEQKRNNFEYYQNEVGELYCLNRNELKKCNTNEKYYGYPLYIPSDIDRFIKYNEFLQEKRNDNEVELSI